MKAWNELNRNTKLALINRIKNNYTSNRAFDVKFASGKVIKNCKVYGTQLDEFAVHYKCEDPDYGWLSLTDYEPTFSILTESLYNFCFNH